MKKKIVIAGGTGMIGQKLTAMLLHSGYEVIILSRSDKRSREEDLSYLKWNPQSKTWPEMPSDIYGIVNLAGAGIADRRWTKKRKEKILLSRVESTIYLAKMIRESGIKPKVYIGTSAIGIYGNRGEERLTEESNTNSREFLAEACRKWENGHLEMEQLCDRTVILRIGLVLSDTGGALSKMTPPLNFGINPYFGKGNQIYSWVHIEDLCRWMLECLKNLEIRGIYNVVAPNPEKAKDFAKKLSSGMGKRTILIPVPVWFLRIILGEMADTVLWSQNVSSEKMQKTGFVYKYPEMEAAVRDVVM